MNSYAVGQVWVEPSGDEWEITDVTEDEEWFHIKCARTGRAHNFNPYEEDVLEDCKLKPPESRLEQFDGVL